MSKFLVIILWLFLGFFYWWVGDRCCTDHAKEEVAVVEQPAPVPAPKKQGPLLFSLSEDSTITNPKTRGYLEGIVGNVGDKERLHLVGQYAKEEINDSKFATLGLARAYATKVLLARYTDTTGITIGAELIPSSKAPEDDYFTAVRFEKKRSSEKIKEINDRTLIYFPYNSTNKLSDEEIEAYLDDVAERVKSSGEKVELVGHTDSFGDAPYNYQLGLQRAKVISAYLKNKGVPSSQLITESKGETTPIAPNNTKEGRAKNRRTELIITK